MIYILVVSSRQTKFRSHETITTSVPTAIYVSLHLSVRCNCTTDEAVGDDERHGDSKPLKGSARS